MKKAIIFIIGLSLFSLTSVAQESINEAQYWIDSQSDTPQNLSITQSSKLDFSGNIDLSGLSNGLHTVHLRFRDASGKNSSVLSCYFVKYSPADITTGAELISFNYWFDGKHDEANTQAISGSQYIFLDEIDINSLAPGLHTLHFQATNKEGIRSPVYSHYIVKNSNIHDTESGPISNIQYWIDGDPDNARQFDAQASKLQLIENLTLDTLKPGLHSINLRVADINGNVCPVVSRYFVVPIKKEEEDHFVTGLRYWLNDSISYEQSIDAASNKLFFLDSLDLRLSQKGEYVINFQFRDQHGNWSGALSDTIQKISFPYALLHAEDAVVCQGDTVKYSALLVDADSIAWDFNDGTFSHETSTSHSWIEPGDYQVSASITDRETGISVQDITANTISVQQKPLVDLGFDLKICQGDTLTLTAPENMANYLWNTGQELNSIVVYAEGSYWLEVENEAGCIGADTVSVLVNDVPGLDLGMDRDLCEGDQLTLSGPENMQTYTWSNGSNSNEIIISEAGTYSLEIVDDNNCKNKDSLYVEVHDLPEIFLGTDIDIVNDESIVLDTGKGFVSYEWNGSIGSSTYEVSSEIQGFGTHLVSVIVRDAMGCAGSDTIVVNISFENTSQTDILSTLKIYPNPTSDYLYIDGLSSKFQSGKLYLLDLDGRIKLIEEIPDGLLKLELSTLNKGTYILVFEGRESMKGIPIIIE